MKSLIPLSDLEYNSIQKMNCPKELISLNLEGKERFLIVKRTIRYNYKEVVIKT